MQQAQQNKYAQLMKELEAKYEVKRAQLMLIMNLLNDE